MKEIIDVLILDDHPIVVNSYESILQNYSNSNDILHFRAHKAFNFYDAVNLIKDKFCIKKYNLLLLDIRIPSCSHTKMETGEDFGIYIKSINPDIKIIAITYLSDNYRLLNILKKLNPDGLIIKNDLDKSSLIYAIRNVLKGKTFYSSSL